MNGVLLYSSIEYNFSFEFRVIEHATLQIFLADVAYKVCLIRELKSKDEKLFHKR